MPLVTLANGVHVSPVMADRLRWLELELGQPIGQWVISGYRSPQEQAELRLRWDAGDRRGIAVRPATDSYHYTGDAIDLAWQLVPDMLRGRIRTLWLRSGGRWGGAFLPPDPGHLDLGRHTIHVHDLKLG